MSARKIVVRADASSQIGTGHVMRCLTLADEVAKRGVKVTFICRAIPSALQALVRQKGHSLRLLPEVSQHDTICTSLDHTGSLDVPWDSDAQQTLHALKAEGGADWLIIDHYALDIRWERTVRSEAANVMVIDDLADRPHDCELLLDQTFGRLPRDYTNLVPEGTNLLLGPQYALLRPQFRRLRPSTLRRRTEAEPLRRILVSFGGTDLHGLTAIALQAISLSAQKVTVEIALGTETPETMELTDIALKMTQEIIFHDFSSNMALLMCNADLAIGAAGTSSWERCCLGLPAVTFILADNQRESAAALQGIGAATTFEIAMGQKKLLQTLTQQLEKLAQDTSQRQAMARTAASVTHGLGAPLAALELFPEKIINGKCLTLMPVTMAHSGLILGWQKEPDIRKFSRNPAPPSEQRHAEWMQQILSDSEHMAWVMEVDHNPAGLLRLEHLAGRVEISILVTRQYQNGGVALSALGTLRQMLPWPDFTAIIHHKNIASLRLFEKAGYFIEQQNGHDNDFLTLRQHGEDRTRESA